MKTTTFNFFLFRAQAFKFKKPTILLLSVLYNMTSGFVTLKHIITYNLRLLNSKTTRNIIEHRFNNIMIKYITSYDFHVV